MRQILFTLTALLFLACSAEVESGLETKIWVGSYETATVSQDVADVQKEIQAKLDMLSLIASDSFKDAGKVDVSNVPSTSTYIIKVAGSDTAKIREAFSGYMDIVNGAYSVRVIEEVHAVE